MIGIYFVAWFPMLILAVINGAARDLLYKSRLGELRAHQVSTVTLIILFSIYMRFIVAAWRPESSPQALLIGCMWLILTLAFEFGFGRFRSGKSWKELFQEYNIFAGRVWIFIPAYVTVAPYLFYLMLE